MITCSIDGFAYRSLPQKNLSLGEIRKESVKKRREGVTRRSGWNLWDQLVRSLLRFCAYPVFTQHHLVTVNTFNSTTT